jgi:hypothetical protein
VTGKSRISNLKLNHFVYSLTLDQRRQFIDALFDILSATENSTIRQIRQERWKSAVAMVRAYKNMDEQTKKALTETLKRLLSHNIRSHKEPANIGTAKMRSPSGLVPKRKIQGALPSPQKSAALRLSRALRSKIGRKPRRILK